MICPRCHLEVQEDMNFCPHCGMKIEKCPNCHQIVMTNTQYCSYCGTPLQQNQSSQYNGYYEPIHYQQDTYEKQNYRDIPVKNHVNKKVIIISVIALIIVSVFSFVYLYNGESLQSFITTNNHPVEQYVQVNSSMSEASYTGNVNMGGEAFITDNAIYMCDDEGFLVKCDLDFSNQTILLKKECEYIYVNDTMIYYVDDNQSLCKMDLEGKNQEVLISKDVYYVNVQGDKIYYQLDDDGESIYVYDTMNHQETKLNNRHSYNINVINQKIYYTSDDGIYSMNINGEDDQKLIDGKIYNLIYQNQKLYYLTEKKEIHSYDLEQSKEEVIIQDAIQLVNLTDQYIFYLNSYKQLQRYSFSNQEVQVTYDGMVSKVYILGDKLLLRVNSFGENDDFVVTDFDGKIQQKIYGGNKDSFV